MIFNGITRIFELANEQQYETIGQFWDEMTALYGLENLRGLGYKWCEGKIYYAIGLKTGDIDGLNLSITLPDDGWVCVNGKTEHLKEIYDQIYIDGALTYEIEEFYEDGTCRIKYFRSSAL